MILEVVSTIFRCHCTYIEVNYTSNTAVCACEVNDKMNDEMLFMNSNQEDKSFTYEDVISVINYKIFKCYRQVFDIKRLAVNVGNYFSIFLTVVYSLFGSFLLIICLSLPI